MVTSGENKQLPAVERELFLDIDSLQPVALYFFTYPY